MQRKLAAILSADVVGYSRLMERDEAGTLERLKANRSDIFDPHVATHGGRTFKLMGDGALVEFPSVVAAVNCALAVQEATEKAEPAVAETDRIRYRIGINLGDIIIDGDDFYGEGVNVAARVQALAPVGGIALSKSVHDHVKGKIPCEFDDMGEHSVKNIETPVHVYFARPSGSAPAQPHHAALPLPSKPSIAVMRFNNLSGDPEQDFFAEGMAEDIITALSKLRSFFVIARALDEEDPWGYFSAGYVECFTNRYDDAIAWYRRAIELNENFALAHGNMAAALALGGQPEEAIEAVDRSLRMSPRHPFNYSYLHFAGIAYFAAGRYAEGVASEAKALRERPAFSAALRFVAACHVGLGQMDKARSAIAQAFRVAPESTIRRDAYGQVAYARENDRERYAEALREAGLPEG